METNKHYFRVGLFIVLVTLGAAAFAVWISTSGHRDDVKYRMYFSESVSGLSQGSAVKFRGVTVGQVTEIAIDDKDSRLIRVEATLNQKTPVKTDTVATLKSTGVTGVVYIDLTGGEPASQNLADATPSDTVPVVHTQPGAVNVLMNELPAIAEKLSNFATQMNKLATDDNIARLNDSLTNLQLITGDVRDVMGGSKSSLVDSSQQLDGTLSNLRRASRNVGQVTDRVKDDPSSLIFPGPEEGVPAP